MPIRTILTLLLTAAALSGCGRRGLLEPPPAPEAVAAQPAGAPAAAAAASAPAPGSGALIDPQAPAAGALDQQSAGSQNPGAVVSPDAPRRRFPLDPLI